MSLQHQTGRFEGGYFPDENVLADALILDSSLNELSEVVLTAGFSSYAQSALEDLLITTKSKGDKRKHVFTTQLQAGHPLLDPGGGSQHKHPRLRLRTSQLDADIVTGPAGQIAIQHNHVIVVDGGLLQRQLPVIGDVHRQRVAPQSVGDRVGQQPFVFHHQNAHQTIAPSCRVRPS